MEVFFYTSQWPQAMPSRSRYIRLVLVPYLLWFMLTVLIVLCTSILFTIPLLLIPGQQAKLATLNRLPSVWRFRGLQSYPSRGYSPTLPGAVPCFAVRPPRGPPISLYTCHRFLSGLVIHGLHHICSHFLSYFYRNFLRLNKKK